MEKLATNINTLLENKIHYFNEKKIEINKMLNKKILIQKKHGTN